MRFRSAVLLSCLGAVLSGPVTPAAGQVPALDHVIVVVMENKDWSAVRGAPYITSLRSGGTEMLYSYGVTQTSSQPNYFALWSGSTQGVSTNFSPLTSVPATAENLGHALEEAGKTWRAYSEDLSGPGGTECSSGGASPLYTRKHDPWTYFTNLDHNNERVYSDLALDIANHTLPNLAFVIPNNCHNMHNTGCTIDMGDTWLSQNLPQMINEVGANGAVILTWDEDNTTPGNGNQILTVFTGGKVKPGYASPTPITHYNVLRTICDALGLAPIANAQLYAPILDIWFDGQLDVSGGTGREIRLSAAVPNPSHGGVTARLTLPGRVSVEAGIFDVTGRAVRSLAGAPGPGTIELRWDGRRDDGSIAGSGVYRLRVRAGDHVLQRPVVMLR